PIKFKPHRRGRHAPIEPPQCPRRPSPYRRADMMPFAILQNLGGPELLIVGAVVLLLFGNRLPSVMRSLGKSVTEFKKGVAGIEEDVDRPVTPEKKTTPE